ncbi:MAG: ribosome biogenesis GTP-binding protein YihA/YsxC [Alphaproteobacteria bacterium]
MVEYSEHIQEESKKEDPVISKSDFSLNELRAGEKLFARSSEFILSVVENNGFPDISLPEIAFAGRSNVGKSSLINSLVGMKKLARVSNTPGRTQTINFFNQNDALVLVDLPGFGYAKASKEDITRWKTLTFDYLRGRVKLECVFLLIDSRHGIKPIDIEVMNILDEAAVSYQIVLTKLDKVKKESLNSLCNNTNSIISKHGAARPFFHLTSSKDNIGLDLLRSTIFKLI